MDLWDPGIEAHGAAAAAAAPRRHLLATVSLEATPKQIARCAGIADRLPAGTAVYLPALPSTTEPDRLAAARTLAAAGLRPVPHIAARRLASRGALVSMLAAYRDAGVDTAMLVAGDVAPPAGPFASTLAVLAPGLLERYGIGRLGVAGHPEGHPAVRPAELDRALAEKVAYARASGAELWLVTQFAFDATPLVDWQARLRAAGLVLPVRAGVPGPATARTLMSYAWQCGVAVSARVLARRPDAARLLGRWAPDAIVADLAAHRVADPDSLITGLHLFPFGGLDAALDWLADAQTAMASRAESLS